MDATPLLNAIIGAMLLLEDSGPEEVSPDTAVRGLEHIGYELNKLEGADRDEFLALVNAVAAAESHVYTARFIRAIPFKRGMVGESPE